MNRMDFPIPWRSVALNVAWNSSGFNGSRLGSQEFDPYMAVQEKMIPVNRREADLASSVIPPVI
jgi:hypothetical protein